jgi:hypothetical protein
MGKRGENFTQQDKHAKAKCSDDRHPKTRDAYLHHAFLERGKL